MNIEKRQEVERKVVRKLVREMKDAGWMPISVFDGEESVAVTTEGDVMDNVFAVDDSNIVFRKAVSPFIPMRRTAVIVLGNDGYDCIADCSVSKPEFKHDDFERIMEGVQEYADKFCK